MANQLISMTDAAKLLNLPRRTFEARANALGLLPVHEHGTGSNRRVFYDQAQVERAAGARDKAALKQAARSVLFSCNSPSSASEMVGSDSVFADTAKKGWLVRLLGGCLLLDLEDGADADVPTTLGVLAACASYGGRAIVEMASSISELRTRQDQLVERLDRTLSI